MLKTAKILWITCQQIDNLDKMYKEKHNLIRER